MAQMHEPSDPNCVRHLCVKGCPATKGRCRICIHYDNAVWLTQREVFEAREGINQ